VDTTANTQSRGHDLQAQSDASQRPAAPFIPQLSKPKKKREGYGFSYSETFWCDSDEYPDTDGDTVCDTETEWDFGTRLDQPDGELSTSFRRQMIQPSPPDSTSGSQTPSFDDVVVLRDVGSFHIAMPQRTLACTTATREDALRLKSQAYVLINRYQESSDVQAQLLSRLERMVYTEQQQISDVYAQMPSLTDCALKLRDFLLSTKDGRIQTGEHHRFVEHEIEWAKWFLEASRTGVMHLRTSRCKCRPDWEES
jgi:hypothetical protein